MPFHAFVRTQQAPLRCNSHTWSSCNCFPDWQMMHNKAEDFKDSPISFFIFYFLITDVCITVRDDVTQNKSLESVLIDTQKLLKWYIFLSWQKHNYIGIFTILFQMRRSRWSQMLRNSSKKQGNWYVFAFHMLTANS